jgi:hypothetical protein
MWMAANQLAIDPLVYVLDAERAALLGNLGVHGDQEEEIAELFYESVVIFTVNCVHDLIGFSEHRVSQRCVRLLPIPRTPVRSTQLGYDASERIR